MDNVYSVERTREAFGRLKSMKKKGELAEALAAELGSLNVHDLQAISAFLEREVGKLPSPYREKVHPYFTEQLFTGYFKLMRMHGDRTLKKMRGDIKDEKLFGEFCTMILSPDYEKREESYYGGYYHLVSCFTMFVLEEPGHPVGMPFPGGFIVERKGDEYYCPIRDKEKDVLSPSAISVRRNKVICPDRVTCFDSESVICQYIKIVATVYDAISS